jgi:hypothetical protein
MKFELVWISGIAVVLSFCWLLKSKQQLRICEDMQKLGNHSVVITQRKKGQMHPWGIWDRIVPVLKIKQHATKSYGGVEVQLHIFLILVLDGGEWSASHFGRFIPRKSGLGTHWILDCHKGGWALEHCWLVFSKWAVCSLGGSVKMFR